MSHSQGGGLFVSSRLVMAEPGFDFESSLKHESCFCFLRTSCSSVAFPPPFVAREVLLLLRFHGNCPLILWTPHWFESHFHLDVAANLFQTCAFL